MRTGLFFHGNSSPKNRQTKSPNNINNKSNQSVILWFKRLDFLENNYHTISFKMVWLKKTLFNTSRH